MKPYEKLDLAALSKEQRRQIIECLRRGEWAEINLVEANLAGANLIDTNLAGANLTGANLCLAYLRNANLARANLEGANLDGANIEGANLHGANLARTNLHDAHLGGANLSDAFLDRAHLRRAYLRGSNLEGANLYGAHLQLTDLRRANLSDTNLNNTDLRGANLRGANLARARLGGTNLEGAQNILNIYVPGMSLHNTPLFAVRGEGGSVHVYVDHWAGTLDEFSARVTKERGAQALYHQAIAFIRSVWPVNPAITPQLSTADAQNEVSLKASGGDYRKARGIMASPDNLPAEIEIKRLRGEYPDEKT